MSVPVVVLVGPPGAGKTSVAAAVASALGVEARDTDADIEATQGRTVAEIFVDDGEQHFRGLEAVAVARALAEHDGVLAVGGGAVLDADTRAALRPHRVVFLDVGLAESSRRVGMSASRPLLVGNVRGRMKTLLDQRRPLYAEVANHVVDTDGREVDAVAAEVLALLNEPTIIRVDTSSPYDVVVGRGLHDRLTVLLGADVRRVAVLHPESLATNGAAVQEALADHGSDTYLIPVPDGERAKTAKVAAACWDSLGEHGFTRTDAIVGVGGGATTDLAGFVAATWLRGVRVVHLPTTLLGMVDAAIGGKTAINTVTGKNLVGAFHQPAGVLCDVNALRTLPPADLIAGLAEVVKCGFVADPAILDLVESSPDAARDPASAVTRELVERAVRVKVDVVVADPLETAGEVGRERLNYGHTFGHAVEQVERYSWRHGDAVAVGMVFVAELARLAGRLDPETADRHRSVLELLGLPTSYRGDAWSELERAMRVDKKTRGDRLRLVVLDGLARPGRLEAPAPDLLTAAYEAVSRS